MAGFTVTIGQGALAAPATPKLADVNAERARLVDEGKIVELQGLVRQLVAANAALVAQLHAAGVTGF